MEKKEQKWKKWDENKLWPSPSHRGIFRPPDKTCTSQSETISRSVPRRKAGRPENAQQTQKKLELQKNQRNCYCNENLRRKCFAFLVICGSRLPTFLLHWWLLSFSSISRASCWSWSISLPNQKFAQSRLSFYWNSRVCITGVQGRPQISFCQKEERNVLTLHSLSIWLLFRFLHFAAATRFLSLLCQTVLSSLGFFAGSILSTEELFTSRDSVCFSVPSLDVNSIKFYLLQTRQVHWLIQHWILV